MKHVFLPEARADLRRLHAFLDTKNPQAAESAMLEIDKALAVLTDNPLMGRPVRGTAELRQLVIPFGQAAYVMHYRPDENVLMVTRVWHSREDRGAP